MGVEQPVDQVEVSGPAASGAHGETMGELRLRPRRERGRLLMPDVDPGDLLPRPDRIRDPVEGVARDAVNALDASIHEGIHEHVGHALRHPRGRRLSGYIRLRAGKVRITLAELASALDAAP